MIRSAKNGAYLGLVLLLGSSSESRAQPPAPPETPSPAVTFPELDCAADRAPPGMACVPGGPAIVGSDEGPAAERPRHQVQLSTFFIDLHEVTNARYRACVAGGVCPEREKTPRALMPLLTDDLPVVATTWTMARRYCAWAGKRLPTEAEWEMAARNGVEGRRFPWGDAPPTCEIANFDGCAPGQTRPRGSSPPGPYGLYDLAGNGYEWVNDWASECYQGCERSCGEPCLGRDPQGPCSGAPVCAGHEMRTLKGGSWLSAPEELRPAHRHRLAPDKRARAASFRCASSTTRLTQGPPWHLEPRPSSPALTPPTAAELATFNAVGNDDDVMQIPACESEGEASHDCRDPMSYIKSNEGLRLLFVPYIRNLGGGYVGIGSDQAYDFIAEARSRWAWLFDYDPEVVRVHQLIRAVVMRSKTPEDFVDAFHPYSLSRTRRWVRQSLAERPDEIAPTLGLLKNNHEDLYEHYAASLQPKYGFRSFGWLANTSHYRYIRKMLRQGRIQVRKGNLLTDVVMPDIARSARDLGVTVRVYYTSNADDQWELTERYRQNIIGLPFDRRSVGLRTVLGRHLDGMVSETQKWVYVVHGAEHLVRLLRRSHTRATADMMIDAIPTHNERLFTIGLPGPEPASVGSPEG